ncbi:E3 ubiquitin-protein ligase Topors-like [Corapipo altera]|uniref:E3 ubiquitin-protein ligase Topors-like n=1 Tax=Corapipo altera TaxID=415028 RepID=UPI000FD6484A|nr:E3 ubiquitin-protein ligase Topors-like [Corapipo altera]
MSQLPPAGPSEVAAADGRCPICLGDLENATYVEVCQHCFCFICIREWAKLTETCPLCKQPFERLLHTVTADGNYEEYVLGSLPTAKGRQPGSGVDPHSGTTTCVKDPLTSSPPRAGADPPRTMTTHIADP